MADANANASASEDAKCRKEDQQEGGTEIEEQQEAVASSDEVASSMSSEESDDEVSLLEVDESSLATAMENAGISIKEVDAESGAFEVVVLSEDVSTFLILAPEGEYLGAKVQGFIPREDGGLSALEMHGQLVEGDVLTHLNGQNAREMNFSDVLKACRSPERGGLPRPLTMRFARVGSLLPLSPSLPGSAATRAAAVDSGGAGENDDEKSDEGNSNGGAGGASSLLEDLMGGLSLTGFGASEPNEAAAREGGEARRLQVPGMAHIKDVFRTELQAQGILGVLEGGAGGDENVSERAGAGDGDDHRGLARTPSAGESLFLHVLRKLESIDVLGEGDVPDETAGDDANAVADNGGAGAGSGGLAIEGADACDSNAVVSGFSPRAAGVGSSFAGVGAKLRSKFRKPSAFGIPSIPSTPLGRGGVWGSSGSGGVDDASAGDTTTSATGAGGSAGVDGGGKAFVEGASKALAVNRDRVMSWMKERRPKDLSPRATSRRAEEESKQEFRRAMRRLYLDAPDPAIHTCMVVARAREQTTPTALEAPTGAAATPTATATATAPALKPARSEGARVIGTGGDSKFAKLSWFRSSDGGGFAEIEGVDGPFYQPSADDIGTHICIKCTLTEAALSPAVEKGGRGRSRAAKGGEGERGGRGMPPSPTRHQVPEVAFAEVGPIILAPEVGAEVEQLLSGDNPAVFRGLVRRDTPGETVRVRVEVWPTEVRVLADPAELAPRGVDEAATEQITGAMPAGGGGGVDQETSAENAAGRDSASAVVDIGEEGLPLKDETAEIAAAAVDGFVVVDGEDVVAGVVGGPGEEGNAGEEKDGVSCGDDCDEEARVLVGGRYESGVLVALDPARPAVLKLTFGQEGGGGGEQQGPTAIVLRATDSRQRDVVALTLRRRRQDVVGAEVVVDDFPERTEAQQEKENYLELKAAAAHFAAAFDEDAMEEDDENDESEESTDGDDDEYEKSYPSSYSSDTDTDTERRYCRETSDTVASGGGGLTTLGGNRNSLTVMATVAGAGMGAATGVECGDGSSVPPMLGSAVAGDHDGGAGERGVGSALVSSSSWGDASPWGNSEGGGGAQDSGPRSLATLLEDLRQARAIADHRERQLKEAHGMWEAGEARREKAEAELRLVSGELDLLRPLSRSLASRAEGKEAADEKVEALSKEVATLRVQLKAAVESAESLGKRAGAVEQEAGSRERKLSGLEKVVRKLGGEAEIAQSELASERAVKEDAVARASKAEREVDQAKARAAVLDNKVASLEREKLELVADANAAKARAEALEAQMSAAQLAETEALTARVKELESTISSLENDKSEATDRMEKAEAQAAEALAKANAAVAAEEKIRSEMASKTEQVMQLTAQRNSAKHRADSLAKDLSRVCGNGRTVDQIEIIVTKYADLKVKMAAMAAEKDGEADNMMPTRADGVPHSRSSMTEAAKKALKQNTELNGRVAALTDTLQVKAHQLDGQRQSNKFLLARVEELEKQIAALAGTPGAPAVGTD